MAVPVLHLNLAPRPSLWRQRHQILGWVTLGVGTAFLLGSLGLTWRAYRQASRAGQAAVSLTEEARRAAGQEQRIQASLQDVDASREQARWKVAERILMERSLPWSRVTAELEQCMVPDMRVKGLQRTRGNNQQVVMKLKAEARTREAEAAFVEALQAAPVFAQVVLERESERQGGGWDLEMSLPAAAVPPPFVVKAVKTAPAGTISIPAPKVAPPVAGRPLPPVGRPAPAPPVPQAGPPVRPAPIVQPQPVPPPPAEPGSDEGDEGRRPRRLRSGRDRRPSE
ncbi:hypothetical protein [Geothrix sp. 21YS21S-4]|uniref:hypothetical protein n=1 Tax=Geothrix sp. 21YS21S-4 TaxID=3068889 RepID=UPI0027BA9A5F|nr:hypothetical protein [Geothrix sp. 21YS21S-4]